MALLYTIMAASVGFVALGLYKAKKEQTDPAIQGIHLLIAIIFWHILLSCIVVLVVLEVTG